MVLVSGFLLALSLLAVIANDIKIIEKLIGGGRRGLTATKAEVINNNGDISKRVLLKSGKNYVNTTIKGALLENNEIVITSNKYAIWTNDEDSPIRGIDELSFVCNRKLEDNYLPQFYGSYNPLNLSDIMNGHYQDLHFIKFSSVSYGGYDYRFHNLPLTDCRYFLAIIPAGYRELTIRDFSISTPCGDEVHRDDESVGYFATDYPQAVKDYFPYLSFVNNGSYTYETYDWGETNLTYLQPIDTYNNILIKGLTDHGFEMTYFDSEYNNYFYQKETDQSGIYTTYMIGTMRQYGDDLVAFDVKKYFHPLLEPSSTWPSNKINLFFENEAFKTITSHNPNIFPEGTQYIVYNYSEGKYKTVSVELCDSLTFTEEEIATTIANCKAYVGYLVSECNYVVNNGETTEETNHYHSEVNSQDGSHSIYLSFNAKDNGKVMFYIDFYETLIDNND